MELISVRELFKNTDAYAGKEVIVGGWVRNRRPSKQFGFIVLNDGTYFNPVQVVYNDTIENFQEISNLQDQHRRCPDRHRHSGADSRFQAALRDPG